MDAIPEVAQLLSLNRDCNWKVVSMGDGVTYEKCKVDWSPVPVVRFHGTMQGQMAEFKSLVDDVSIEKRIDSLVEKMEEIEQMPDGSRVLYAAYTTPVFFVSPRDVVVRQYSCTLSLDDESHYGVRPNTFISARTSVEHELCPEKKGYVRAVVSVYGWICEPLEDNSVRTTLLAAGHPKGMLPSKAVEFANGEQVKKWKKMRTIFES